jgi:MFS family permease
VSQALSRGTALRFVILASVVSLLGDTTYEGARSVTGPFLATLGASATAVGFVAGFGELLGFGLRLVSGYVTDRTRRYWTVAILGYAVNLLAVPALALAGRWETAAFLMILERAGKGIRNPARDAMLSHATKEMGRGWGFGLHEAMDQIGAVVGPILVAGALYARQGYRNAFAMLLVPASLALAVLLINRFLYPNPRDLEVSSSRVETKGLRRSFWLYLSAVALIAAGYADFPLIAYHFKGASVAPEDWIPLFYAVAMGVDALAALAFGRLFDRIGLQVLIVSSLLSFLFAPLVFLGGFHLALLGMVLWGAGMGAQESVMRAAIAEMAQAERRGTAYGVFNSIFGLSWFLGSAIMGILYDISLTALILFSMAAQLGSIPLLMAVRKGRNRDSMSPLPP